jgi:hypothetical protein
MIQSRGSQSMPLARRCAVGSLTAALLIAAAGLEAARAQAPVQAPVQAPAEVAGLTGKHPAEYYLRAGQLLKDGRKDDAVFVFYLGQLRYRAHLLARPELPPDRDPAAFSSLSAVIGRPLNEYAFGDIPRLARTIDAVLAYDAANPDGFTSPARFAQVYAGVRDGLEKLKTQMLRDADSIRAARAKNGLQNRSQ